MTLPALAAMSSRCSHGFDPVQAPIHTCPELVALAKDRGIADANDAASDDTKASIDAGPLGKVTPQEWACFTSAIRQVARDGMVRQNDIRPLIRGRIFHKHIGACYSLAKSRGLLVEVTREQSADTAGRNTHHDSGVYRLGGAR